MNDLLLHLGSIAILGLSFLLIKLPRKEDCVFWVSMYLVFAAVGRTLSVFGLLTPNLTMQIIGLAGIIPFVSLLVHLTIVKK